MYSFRFSWRVCACEKHIPHAYHMHPGRWARARSSLAPIVGRPASPLPAETPQPREKADVALIVMSEAEWTDAVEFPVHPCPGIVDPVKFIIDTYYELPEYCAFVYGERLSWYHDGDLQQALNSLSLAGDMFRSFNNEFSYRKHSVDDVLRTVSPVSVPSMLVYRTPPQFVVHRSMITRHPRDVYESWLENLRRSVEANGFYSTREARDALWCLMFTGLSDEEN
jgi:hypothetical protein